MTTRPISENDLHAFIDEQLDDERCSEVLTYLAENPQEAARMEAYKHERHLLRAALAPMMQEPLPSRLNIRHIAPTRRKNLLIWIAKIPHWAMGAAAAVLLLSIGMMSSWMLHGASEKQSAGLLVLGHEAIANYSLYALDQMRPVELRAQEKEALLAWARQHVGKPVLVPQLSGYRFMGGRVLASSYGASVLFMYDDDKGNRLVMLSRPMQETKTPMMPLNIGSIYGFSWADNGFGVSLVGHAPPEILHPLAQEIRQQVRLLYSEIRRETRQV